jgi:hypothetical protein
VLLGTALDTGTGRVDLVTHTVFPAGTVVTADRPLSKQISIFGPPVATANPAVTLPLLARRGTEPARWPVLRLPRTEVPAGGTGTVTVTLTAPGRLRCSTGDGDLSDGAPESLQTGLRRRTTELPVPPPLDVVCLVELCGGTRAEVSDRLDVLMRTVDALTGRYAGRDGLRVGAVGYFDHVVSEAPGDPPRELFRVVDLGEPDQVRSQVAAWRPAQRLRDYATAVGDALARANRLRWRRDDPAVERAVLLIGRRPPEARNRSGDPIPLCPLQTDWRAETNRLRTLGARRVARVDLPADWPGTDPAGRQARSYAEHAWRQVATDGVFREDRTPEQLADLLSRQPTDTGSWVFPFPFLTAER